MENEDEGPTLEESLARLLRPLWAVREGVMSEGAVDDLCIIASVFIHWEAADDKKMCEYNYQATKEAIARALSNAQRDRGDRVGGHGAPPVASRPEG